MFISINLLIRICYKVWALQGYHCGLVVTPYKVGNHTVKIYCRTYIPYTFKSISSLSALLTTVTKAFKNIQQVAG